MTSQVISAIRHPTYIQLFYGEYDPEARYTPVRVTHMEIRIRHDNLAKLPHRGFAPPCRSLCGFDLHRWHVTCLLSCLLRRVYYGKMPAKIPVQGYVVWIHKGRRLERVKAPLLKRLLTICEQLAVTPMRNKTILIVLVGIFLTLNFLDFATTMYAAMHLRGEEANPIVNALGGPLDHSITRSIPIHDWPSTFQGVEWSQAQEASGPPRERNRHSAQSRSFASSPCAKVQPPKYKSCEMDTG